MKYTIIYTKSFEVQLEEVVDYWSKNFSSEIAYNYYLEIKRSINNLSSFPYLGGKFYNIINKRKTYRMIPIRKHVIIYDVNENENQIILYAIISFKQQYSNIIRNIN